MKKLFAIIISIVLILGCTAHAESGKYLFVQTEEGVFISGYEGDETVLKLPESFKNEPVVGICEGAFKGNRNIKEVMIPDSYVVIGVEAFAGCTSLKDVYLGNGIRLIDERAFTGCVDLLSVTIVQFEFEVAPNAFDFAADEIPYNGADVQLHLANNTGEPYNMLYIAGCDMMSRGEFEAARNVFLSLYGYELSADYYFYCSARVYEQRGDIDSALAIYALMPDLNDCQARLDYYKGEAEVGSFFDCPEYTLYYDYYFGENGSYNGWLEYANTEGETVIGGADAPTDIIVGDGLGQPEVPEATEAPTEEEAVEEPEEVQVSATVEPNPALMSYQDFSGDMPFSLENRTASEGFFALYFDIEDVRVVYDYAAIFEAEGWEVISETDTDGWVYLYVVNNENGAYFMVGYSEAEGMLILMYEADLPYGFDPLNGL